MACIVTTSWDDGDIRDTRLADLLDKYNIKGTFYLSRDYRRPRVSDAAIREIAKRHEIGAHTLSHPNLTEIERDVKQEEIQGGKKWLEDVLGKPIDTFCYPGGQSDDETIAAVKEAGFISGRTTKAPVVGEPFDPYRFGVSMTLFPYPFTISEKIGTVTYRTLGFEPWHLHAALEKRALELFEHARKENGIFHLYGHSWANTKYGLWPVLERILCAIGGSKDCEYLTNGEVIKRVLKTGNK